MLNAKMHGYSEAKYAIRPFSEGSRRDYFLTADHIKIMYIEIVQRITDGFRFSIQNFQNISFS